MKGQHRAQLRQMKSLRGACRLKSRQLLAALALVEVQVRRRLLH